MQEISPAESLKRRRNRVMFVVFGALALAVALFPSMCAYMDQPQRYWPTYAQSPREGPDKLPRVVPPSATEIHTRRDDRSGLLWIRFAYPPAEHDRLVMGMRRLSQGEATVLHVDAPGFTPWWTLNERTMMGRAGKRLEGYAIPGDLGGQPESAWLFLDPSSNLAFYWRRTR
jgi:hypothetical protein